MFEDQVRRHFPALEGTIYLNSAAMGVPPATAAAALRDVADSWERGRLDWLDAERAGEEVRDAFARLVGTGADCVALVPAASSVAGLVAQHFRARPDRGGNVVVGADEFTSNLFAWLLLEQAGYEIRRVPFTDGALPEAAVADAVDGRTVLVAVSAVQSASGYRADLGHLREIAGHAVLYVDAAQAAGALAIDMDALGVDALAAPSHKFLLGSRGMGYAAFSSAFRDQLQPVWAGWKAAAEPLASFYGPAMALSPTASRFDQSLAWPAALAERESVRVLDALGRAAIHAHDAALAERLVDGLRAEGVPFWDHGPAHRSPIISCAPPSPEAGMRLADAGIVAGARAGRVRLAVHLYVTAEQVDRVVEVLARP